MSKDKQLENDAKIEALATETEVSSDISDSESNNRRAFMTGALAATAGVVAASALGSRKAEAKPMAASISIAAGSANFSFTYSTTEWGIQDVSSANWYVHGSQGAETSLYYNGSEKLKTKNGGVDIAGHLTVGTSSGPSSVPEHIYFGRYSSVAGRHPQVLLYGSGTLSDYGVGVSGSQLNFMVPSSADFVWYGSGLETMRLSSGSGDLAVGGTYISTSGNKSTPLLKFPGIGNDYSMIDRFSDAAGSALYLAANVNLNVATTQVVNTSHPCARVIVDGRNGNINMQTAAAGAGNPVTRMIVDDSGSTVTGLITATSGFSTSGQLTMMGTGTGTYNRTVLYSDSSNGILLEAAKVSNSNGASGVPITLSWRGTSNSFVFTDNGTLTCVDFTATSDRSLKNNIRKIENPLSRVLNLTGYVHGWKDGAPDNYGFMHDEVEHAEPMLAQRSDKTNLGSVNYTKTAPLFVEAIKELKAENDELKVRVEKAESNNTALVERLEKLEKLLN